MLQPDPKQRMILGWQIRWVAGLSCMLLVAAGAIPAAASDGIDCQFDGSSGALRISSQTERNAGRHLGAATGEFLASSSAWEPELEEDQTDLTADSLLLSLFSVHESIRTERRDEQSARSAFDPGILSPRAPPRI